MRRSFVPAVVSFLCVAGCGSTSPDDKVGESGAVGTPDPGPAPKTEPSKSEPAPQAAPEAAAKDAGKPATNPTAGAAQAAAAESAEDLRNKAEDAENQLDLARTRLDRARVDLEQQKLDAALALDKANVELVNAQKALDHFVKVEMPQKRSRGELDLQQAKDYLTEQEEELQQLELMYKKDDLADKTKEIVLARSKRRLERARQNIALQQKDLDDLLNVQQPDQKQKLELAVRDREADVRRADVGAKNGTVDKQMAVRTVELDVNRLIREVDKAKQKAAHPTPPAGQ